MSKVDFQRAEYVQSTFPTNFQFEFSWIWPISASNVTFILNKDCSSRFVCKGLILVRKVTLELFEAHTALETYKRHLMIIFPLIWQIRTLTQGERCLCCAAFFAGQWLVADVGLILVAADDNLDFYIFKCFEYAQWGVNAKQRCFNSTALFICNWINLQSFGHKIILHCKNEREQLKVNFHNN